ncbi:hypothetical protein BDF20DRAFT_919941 [Mycotypha africana]|uniref:uncharacterized protein n=1 Tax=Mycotypha africana TaxID=64632 RepID=UPI0023000873|nr:uncharacterized protein BDF20DRAFT_919941 [Mycotypha africana]KAI8991373.1 hypothetical protein BDF20DRAFT_919941 [Mycotypha africana]
MRLIALIALFYLAIIKLVVNAQGPAPTSSSATVVQSTAALTSNNAAAQPTPTTSSGAPASGPSIVATPGGGINNNSTTSIITAILGGSNNQTAPSGSGAANSLAGLPTSATFGNTIYPGAATFLTPTASKSVLPLYRIDSRENVTFVWQFTDLKVQPANLTLAAVAPNKVTYTISALPGLATSAVWHIKDVPTASPLMMGDYQIQLYDQRGVSAVQQPGWLAPNTRLTIAFYSPESYSAIPSGSDYCPLCFYSGGRRLSETFGPIAIAFGIASVTSGMILYGLIFQ